MSQPVRALQLDVRRSGRRRPLLTAAVLAVAVAIAAPACGAAVSADDNVRPTEGRGSEITAVEVTRRPAAPSSATTTRPRTEVPPSSTSTEIEDEDLSELRDDCADGDMEACDDLYYDSPVGSDDEAFGETCGRRHTNIEPGTCAQAQQGGTTGGSNELSELRDDCADGDMEACDDLYYDSPVGSDDEAFGETCGRRHTNIEPGTCAQAQQGGTTGGSNELSELRDDCADGDMEACDDLYYDSPVGSDDEAFGETCGRRHTNIEPGTCAQAQQGGTASGSNGSTRGADSSNGTVAPGTYRGTAEVVVDVYDYCGPGAARSFDRTERFTFDVALNIGRPVTDGELIESNEFSMQLAVGPDAAEGSVFMQSALVATTPETMRQVVLQYWGYELRNGQLQGTLGNDHIAEGAAINLINGQNLLVPCRPELGELPGGMPAAVAEGATISGSLTETNAQLRLQGATTDGLRAFTVTISASR